MAQIKHGLIQYAGTGTSSREILFTGISLSGYPYIISIWGNTTGTNYYIPMCLGPSDGWGCGFIYFAFMGGTFTYYLSRKITVALDSITVDGLNSSGREYYVSIIGW